MQGSEAAKGIQRVEPQCRASRGWRGVWKRGKGCQRETKIVSTAPQSECAPRTAASKACSIEEAPCILRHATCCRIIPPSSGFVRCCRTAIADACRCASSAGCGLPLHPAAIQASATSAPSAPLGSSVGAHVSCSAHATWFSSHAASVDAAGCATAVKEAQCVADGCEGGGGDDAAACTLYISLPAQHLSVRSVLTALVGVEMRGPLP